MNVNKIFSVNVTKTRNKTNDRSHITLSGSKHSRSSTRVSKSGTMNDDNSNQREETLHTHGDHDVSSFWFVLNSLNTLENMSTFDNMMCKMNNVELGTKKSKVTKTIKKRNRKKCLKS